MRPELFVYAKTVAYATKFHSDLANWHWRYLIDSKNRHNLKKMIIELLKINLTDIQLYNQSKAKCHFQKVLSNPILGLRFPGWATNVHKVQNLCIQCWHNT